MNTVFSICIAFKSSSITVISGETLNFFGNSSLSRSIIIEFFVTWVHFNGVYEKQAAVLIPTTSCPIIVVCSTVLFVSRLSNCSVCCMLVLVWRVVNVVDCYLK